MKINLTKITFRPSLTGPELTQDLHRDVAEAVYQAATTCAAHSLALRIFDHGDADVEVSEEEKEIIRNAITNWHYFVQEAVIKILEQNN